MPAVRSRARSARGWLPGRPRLRFQIWSSLRPVGTGWCGRYRCTDADPVTISWKLTGGLVIEHLPADRTAMARTLNWAVPVPPILAYAPVPPER